MRTTTRLRRGAAAVAAVAALGLGAAACGSSGSSASSSNSGSSEKTSDAPSAAASSSGNGEGDGNGKSSGSDDAKAGGGASAKSTDAAAGGNSGGGSIGGTSATRCKTADMTAGWGSDGGGVPDMKKGDGGQTVATAWMKNTGSTTCTLFGYPGVTVHGTNGKTTDLARATMLKPAKVTLKPGEHTSFAMTLLLGEPNSDREMVLDPDMVLITPPDEREHFQLKWPYGGTIQDTSAATHPGDYVSPVGQG